MELKLRKRINNTLPGYIKGLSFQGWDNVGALAGNILGQGMLFLGSINNAGTYDRTADDLSMNAGQSSGSYGGYGYRVQNYADAGRELAQVDSENTTNTWKTATSGISTGAALGATFGPIGAGIGAVVGGIGGWLLGSSAGDKRKAEAERALQQLKQRAEILNNVARSGAINNYLVNTADKNLAEQNKYVMFNKGKDSWTSVGKMPWTPNARVAGGEAIFDNINDVNSATGMPITEGKKGVDGPTARVSSSTFIPGNDIDWRDGLKFADKLFPYAAALHKINEGEAKIANTNKKYAKFRSGIGKDTEELQAQEINKLKAPIVEAVQDAARQQEHLHVVEAYHQTMNARRGKDSLLPGFFDGFDIAGPAVSLLGMAAGNKLYADALNDHPYKPTTYVTNPYELAALSELNRLNINTIPTIQLLRDQEARTANDVYRAGGLSASQRHLSRIASLNSLLQNTAQLMQNAQVQNNAYRANYASALMNAGQANRQVAQQANQYDLDYYSKSHAARQQQMQMGQYNMLAALEGGLANAYKKWQFDKTYKLYQDDQKTKQRQNNLQSSPFDDYLKGVLSNEEWYKKHMA